MNQEDREFITNTIKSELASTNKAIDELAIITARGFVRMDEEFNKVWICLRDLNTKVDSIDGRLIVVEKKIDKIGTNYVRDTTHHELDKRVKKLELSRV